MGEAQKQNLHEEGWDKTMILTFATGSRTYLKCAQALAASLDYHHSRAKRVLITDVLEKHPEEQEFTHSLFDEVLPVPQNFDHWFIKLCALESTNADRILFIDSDCLAVRNVDAILSALAGSEFAVHGWWRSDFTAWYGDINSVMQKLGLKAIPQFSGGFLYYERTERTQQLIQEILQFAESYDSLGLERNGGHVVDEVCISLAMAKTGIGTVVPQSAEFSNTPWNAVGKVRLDVMRGIAEMPTFVERPLLLRPAIYHSAMGRWDLLYWRNVHRMLSFARKMHRERQKYRLFHVPLRWPRRLAVIVCTWWTKLK